MSAEMTALSIARPASAATLRPGLVIALLLVACLIKGPMATQGALVPPDPDTVWDLGFIQGFLDGNWMGDPITEGAWRWYPPLPHASAALVLGGLRLPLLATWLHAGIWLNLLSPLSFYLMNRRLIGAWPSVVATALLVLAGSAVSPGDAVAGYTPWTLTPTLVWPLFFASVWLIAVRVRRFRMIDAGLIGSALGLVFLAHTVPAVLLSAIAASAAVAVGGFTVRMLVWLGIVAFVELVWSVPFLGPLIAAYHLGIGNPVPGAWMHPVLTNGWTLLPNLAGLGALGWLTVRREWRHLPAASAGILEAWIAVCAGFLARHYVCSGLNETGGVCGVFVVAVHHYHAYLQAAWATVGGLALARPWETGRHRDLEPLMMLAWLVGVAWLFGKADDLELHRLSSTQPELILDRAAYKWILAETSPRDLFVTELPARGVDMGPAAATVIAAGRRLVAPPESHANPYMAWVPRNARRIGYLIAGSNLCPLLRQAGDGGGTAFFLLRNVDMKAGQGRLAPRLLASSAPAAPAGAATDAFALETGASSTSTRASRNILLPAFRGVFNTIYRVTPNACGSGKGGEDLLQRPDLVAGGG